MTTPLIILSILFVPTGFAAAYGFWSGRPEAYRTVGLWALSAAFVFFGVGHFAMTDDMIRMLPEIVPARGAVVAATGILEFLLALMLLVPSMRRDAGILCVAVFVLFFTANVYGAVHHAGPGGHQWGLRYLWIRAPLQVLLVMWAYWFAIRPGRSTGAEVYAADDRSLP